MHPSNRTSLLVRRTALGLLLALAGACDCSGSDGPSDPADAAPDADVGTGDVSEDLSTDVGEDPSEDTSTDASPDAEPDADATPDAEEDADVPEERAVRTVITNTAGGGVVSSPNTRAVIGLGAPQPAGTADGENTSVTTGPGAARP